MGNSIDYREHRAKFTKRMKGKKRNEIIIWIGTKGGAGKTVGANHIGVTIFKLLDNKNKVSFLEVDDNNFNQVSYENSSSILSYKSITLDRAEEELQNILTELFIGTKTNHVIDAGGGNDTIKLISQINAMKLDETMKITYVIPFNSSNTEMSNVKNLVKSGILKDNRIIYACNRIQNMVEVKEEFKAFFGQKENKEEDAIVGLKNELKIKDSDIIYIPDSKYFDMAVMKKKNIYDFSQPAENFNFNEYVEYMTNTEENKKGEKLNKDELRELTKSIIRTHNRSSYVLEFRDSIMPSILDVFLGK